MAASAEAAYLGLDDEQQALAPEVFRRLIATGPDGRPVRRTLTRAELRAGRRAGEDAGISAVLDAFARHRLLMLDGDRCEIPQDVLIEDWPRLRRWLAEDQASVVLHGQLAEDAARWRGSDRDGALLYRGVQLAATSEAARAWAADPGRYPALGGGEAEFLRASGSAAARTRRRRQALAAVAAWRSWPRWPGRA